MPLLQMPRRHCKTCRSPLQADDTHAECVSCLGKSLADAALSGADCSHCESFSLASLRSKIAFFSESDSAPRALPFSSSQVPQWSEPPRFSATRLPSRKAPPIHSKEPPLAKARRDSRHGAQKKGCHDRRFQQGLGSAVRGQTDLRSVVRGGIDPAHQLPRNASSMSGLSILPTGHMGTPCASMLRQQVRGVIHKSPGRPRLEATLHAGERPSCVGPEQSALAEGDACAGQNKPRSRHVVEEQRLFGGMDASQAHGSENLGNLWP